jgi:autophagy-related protein 2
MLEHSINVFSSVDEDAFRRINDIVSGGDADMIEDDLPTNLDYLDEATRRANALSTDRSTGETLRTWQTEGDHLSEEGGKVAAEVNGETIKILYSGPVEMEEGYWDNLPVLNGVYGDE